MHMHAHAVQKQTTCKPAENTDVLASPPSTLLKLVTTLLAKVFLPTCVTAVAAASGA